MRRCRVALVASVLLGPAAAAQQMPPHLTQLGGQVYEANRAALARDLASPDAARRAVAAAADGVFRQARVANWSRAPVDLAAPFARAAAALSLDPADPGTLDTVRGLTAMLGDERAAAIRDRLGAAAPRPQVEAAEAALDAFATAGGAPAAHVIGLGGGVGLAVEWSPESGGIVLRAQNDVTGPQAFEYVMAGRTEVVAGPDGGVALTAAADPARPPKALSAVEIEDRALSILGTWEADGMTMDIRAADAAAGEVRRSAALVRREIEAERARIAQLRNAKEFVWRNPQTDEIVRQQRFRRLSDPWVYDGERALAADVDAQVAEAESRIARLEAELTGDDRPTAEKLDPIAFEAVKRHPAARALRIDVREGDACRYACEDAWFDGRRLVGRRTHGHPCTVNRTLPAKVAAELIARWSPPHWLLLRADYADDGALSLEGAHWGLYVAYDPEDETVNRVFGPHAARPAAFREGGGRTYVAFGAAAGTRP